MSKSEGRNSLIKLFQNCGLFPIKICNKNFTPTESSGLRKWSIFLILFFAIPIFTVYAEHEIFLNKKKSGIVETVDFIQLISMRSSALLIVCEAFLNRKSLMNFFNDLHEIHELMTKINVKINFNRELRKNFIVIMLSMTFYFSCELMVLGCFYLRDTSDLSIYWSFYIPFYMVCCLRYLQLISFVLIIKRRIDIVNRNLSKISQLTHETQHKLEVLRQILYKLYSMSLMVNNFFGLSTLINIANDFITVTLNSFFVFVSFQNLQHNTIVKIFESFFWCTPHCVNIIALATCCQLTLQSTYKTALYVHRIGFNAEPVDNKINHGKNQLFMDFMRVKVRSTNFFVLESESLFMNHFSLQLLHQKIQFTAFGFINIDFTLLYAIAATVTTYLVILIQFHLNERKD